MLPVAKVHFDLTSLVVSLAQNAVVVETKGITRCLLSEVTTRQGAKETLLNTEGINMHELFNHSDVGHTHTPFIFCCHTVYYTHTPCCCSAVYHTHPSYFFVLLSTGKLECVCSLLVLMSKLEPICCPLVLFSKLEPICCPLQHTGLVGLV